MKRLARFLAVIGAFAVIGALIGAFVVAAMVRHGFSARDQPSQPEKIMATTMRRMATSSAMKHKSNPLTVTPDMLMEARAHFADHCAQCHGNDGKGDTEMGRNLYPKAPDLRAETQALSDGEIFDVIQNGVRLTGMPAWGGTSHAEHASWALVAFIRQLPKLTEEDLQAMEYLNPKSPEEWQESQDEAAFLTGAAPKPSTDTHSQHGGH